MGASAEIPLGVVSAVIAVARSRRVSPNADGTFDDDASLEAASPALERPNHSGDELFPYPVLTFDR